MLPVPDSGARRSSPVLILVLSGQITSHFLRKSIFQSIDQTIKNRVLPQQGCLAKKGLEELSHSKVRKGPPSRAPKSNICAPSPPLSRSALPPNVPSVTLPSGICSSQQRAPNQQRHKHCLLALTWHWPQIPGPAQRLWAIGSGARKDLETSISSQHRQTHLPQRRRPRTDESPHHYILPFRIRRFKHPRQIPVFVQFFVDWCAHGEDRSGKRKSCHQKVQSGIDTGNEAFASICKSLRRSTGQ
jgi:hypothetical protein